MPLLYLAHVEMLDIVTPLCLDPTKHARLHAKHGPFYYVLRKARHFLDLLIEMEQGA